MPQTQSIAPTVLRLHREDAAQAAARSMAPTRLDYEAHGRVTLRHWTVVQWAATPEARRPSTAIELVGGGWIDLAPA